VISRSIQNSMSPLTARMSKSQITSTCAVTVWNVCRVDADLHCIKGGGACQLREKVLAEVARTFVFCLFRRGIQCELSAGSSSSASLSTISHWIHAKRQQTNVPGYFGEPFSRTGRPARLDNSASRRQTLTDIPHCHRDVGCDLGLNSSAPSRVTFEF